MVKDYQNGVIAQLLEAIVSQVNFDGEPISNIGDILLSILEQTPYDKEPKSVLAELFLKLKDKLEGRAFTPYDKEPKSAIAEILLSILNETEYDKEPNSRITELLLELKAELESYAELTASGAIANFTTSVVKPLVNLTSYFKATQEAGTPTPQSPKAISGVSAVSVIQGGKNFGILEQGTLNLYSGAEELSTNRVRTNFIPVKKGAIYIASSQNNGWVLKNGIGYDENKNYVRYNINHNISTGIITIPDDISYIRFIYGNSDNTDCSPSDYWYQFEVGSTKSAYEPYIEPITTLINLGGTYYGGYISQDKNGKRELTVTCVKEHISLQGKAPYTSNGYDSWFINLLNRSLPPSNNSNKMCSVCGTYLYDGIGANIEHFYIGATSLALYLTENTFRGGEIDIVYPLETPFTVELPDGEPIITLNGVNNIYNDSGNTSVTYLALISDNITRGAKMRAVKKAEKLKLKEQEKQPVIIDPIETKETKDTKAEG